MLHGVNAVLLFCHLISWNESQAAHLQQRHNLSSYGNAKNDIFDEIRSVFSRPMGLFRFDVLQSAGGHSKSPSRFDRQRV